MPPKKILYKIYLCVLIKVDFVFHAKCFALSCLENAVNFMKPNIFKNENFRYFLYKNAFHVVKRCVVENFIPSKISHLQINLKCILFYLFFC